MKHFIGALIIGLLFIAGSGCYTQLTVVASDEPDNSVVQNGSATIFYDDPLWYPRLGFYYYYPQPDYWYPEWWYYRWPHRHVWWDDPWHRPHHPWYGWYNPPPYGYWWNHQTLSTEPSRPNGIRRFGPTRGGPLGNPRDNMREAPREKKPGAPARLHERRNDRVAPKPDTPPRREQRITPQERPRDKQRPPEIKPNRSPQRPRPETVRPSDKPRDRNDTGTRRPNETTRKRPRP